MEELQVFTIKEICENYKITQSTLARRFNIPLRTVQDWHSGRRKPPEYLVDMIVELLDHDAAHAKNILKNFTKNY